MQIPTETIVSLVVLERTDGAGCSLAYQVSQRGDDDT
jgi:hypothetical protein